MQTHASKIEAYIVEMKHILNMIWLRNPNINIIIHIEETNICF